MKRILVTLVVLCGLLAIGIGASGLTSSTPLKAGNSVVITCPTALSDTNIQPKSETVNCAKKTPPTTTTTTTVPVGTTTTSTTTSTVPVTTTITSTTTTSTTVPPSTTTTTVPAGGGNCTDPTFSSSNAEATDNTDPGNDELYWVNNDAWNGGHGPQTINVCSQSSWNAVSDQPNDGGAVETYPDTEYDVAGRGNPNTTTLASYPDGSITSTFSEAYPSAGGWDAAYDLWTDNWTNETMAWNQWAGSQSYWANCGASTDPESACGMPQSAQNINIGGVLYNFVANGPGGTTDCTTANEADCELMFFRQTQVTSGSIDIAAIYQWEVANGYAKASDIPTQLEYGVEVCYATGTETFPTTGLTFSLTS